MLSVVMLAASAALAAPDPEAVRRGLFDEAGWAEVGRKDQDGLGEVVIRHKQISGLDCLEGTAQSDVSVQTLIALAADIAAQPSFSSFKLLLSEKLSQGQTSFDYVQLLENPFPVKDRYWFAQGTIGKRGASTTFEWVHIDPAAKYPERLASLQAQHSGAVPTEYNVGGWVFTPVDAGVQVQYKICSDVGGSIPKWAGEFAAKSTLPTNISDLVGAAKAR